MSLLFVLCTSVFASTMSWRIVEPMMPVIAGDLGVSLGEVVLLASAFSLPSAAMQLVFGPLGDAWDRVRLIRLSLGVLAISLLLMAFAPTLPLMMAARVLGGAFSGGINPVALALLSEQVPLEQRQVALGRFLVAHITGQMLGAAAAGLLVDLIGWRAVFAFGALIVAVVFGVTLVKLTPGMQTRIRPSIPEMLRIYRGILSGSLAQIIFASLVIEGILVLGLIAFVPALVLERPGAGPAEAGIVIACFAFGGVAFGILVRPVLARLGPWNMMRAGGVLTGAALLGSALPIHWSVLALLFAAIGFGFYMMHNSIQLRATELAPHARGVALSLCSFFFFAGQGIGPMIGALFIGGAGLAALFMGAGALTMLFGVAAAAMIGSRMRPHREGEN